MKKNLCVWNSISLVGTLLIHVKRSYYKKRTAIIVGTYSTFTRSTSEKLLPFLQPQVKGLKMLL